MTETKATAPAPKPDRVDRDEVFLEYTKSVCPVCKSVIDAEVNARDNKVYLRKTCTLHGRFEAVVYADAELYLSYTRFNKPGTLSLATQTDIKDGCPLDCGLCPEHKQHACAGIIEVNTACNLDCPVCFAESGHQHDGFSLTHAQVEAALDAFVAAEGQPEMVMFSASTSSSTVSAKGPTWPSGVEICAGPNRPPSTVAPKRDWPSFSSPRSKPASTRANWETSSVSGWPTTRCGRWCSSRSPTPVATRCSTR